jgi:hypothetical protein
LPPIGIAFVNQAESRAFSRVLRLAAAKPEMVSEFDRLHGSNLSRRGSADELAGDVESGRLEADLARFAEFVHAALWLKLPDDVRCALISAAEDETV